MTPPPLVHLANHDNVLFALSREVRGMYGHYIFDGRTRVSVHIRPAIGGYDFQPSSFGLGLGSLVLPQGKYPSLEAYLQAVQDAYVIWKLLHDVA